MHSSTSNSRHPAVFHAKALVAACAALAILFEIASSYLLKHRSETYSRVSEQYASALRVRPALGDEPASVLMVGNSLLLYGVDVNRLRTLTSDQVHVYPVFLEATGYYDWLYALQRLFERGSRPQVVVLGVGMHELFANGIRRDYAPIMFLNARDVLNVASDLNFDRTQTADLLLAHWSAFWDLRSVVRVQVLRHTIPHCEELLTMLEARPSVPRPASFETLAAARLERLRVLCATYGARLLILVPPAPSSANAVQELAAVSRRVGVPTLVPLDPHTVSDNYFLSDEIHLNPHGAELFTSALAHELPGIANRSIRRLLAPE